MNSGIIKAIEAFLRHGGIHAVHVAGGTTPPPQLAYMVNLPRVSVVLSGEYDVEIERDGAASVVSVRAGQSLLIPANCWDRPLWSSRGTVITFLFGKRQTGVSLVRNKALTRLPPVAAKGHFPRPMTGPVPGILDALINTGTDFPAETAPLLMQAMLHCCLTLLNDAAAKPKGKADKTFQNICLYLQMNFHFPVTRDSVADLFRLSPNHVSRLFRREGLMKFVDYLTFVRLDRAKYLLRFHNLTVDEVARSCGYGDTGYFCRTFKQKTKMTPTAYRLMDGAQNARPG